MVRHLYIRVRAPQYQPLRRALKRIRHSTSGRSVFSFKMFLAFFVVCFWFAFFVGVLDRRQVGFLLQIFFGVFFFASLTAGVLIRRGRRSFRRGAT